MIHLAINIHVPKKTLFVGDRDEDIKAALSAGVDFLWADVWREARCGGEDG